ncbi:oxygenase MpaB family protein [Kitasatospora purpeofusca]|uniref:oxygenase MpaB family protein n=1 Tax=Kitasatospora purpeofusca TaxID=67352 RepID=UPI003F4AB3FD
MDHFVTRRSALTAALATGAAVGLPAAAATARVSDRPAAPGPAPGPASGPEPGPGPAWELPADQAAQEGDPEADEVIEELVNADQMQLANRVFHDWTRNDQPVPDSAPSVLSDFLRRHAVLTQEERASIDLIKNGDLGKLVQGNIEALTMTEAFGGLFTALADPLLAKSVWYAGFDLVMDIGRRFSRTMNTLWDGLDGGNWDPSGNALISLVKLRLVHAAARRAGLAHGWNQARDGMPISQRLEAEELMYVGANNVQLAAKFGFHPDPRQIDELVELIRIGGRLLGIQEKYNPRTLDQCNQILADAAAHHRAPSDEGIKLARNMLDWLDRKVFPGAGAVGASLVRMMDAHVADVLDIKPNPALDIPVATLGPHLYRPVYEIQQKFPLLVPVHEKMFRIASKTVAWYAVDFRDYDLQMPVH